MRRVVVGMNQIVREAGMVRMRRERGFERGRRLAVDRVVAALVR